MIFKLVFLLFIFLNFQQCLILKLRSIQLNMYLTSSFDFCMRYLTKNSITGCSSHSSGNRGRLINISSLNDLRSSEYSFPIIILIPARKDLLEYAIFHSPMVVGILIDKQTIDITDDYFTEVSICPENFNDSSTCSIRKNKYGINFRGIFIDKPIFLLTNQTVVEQIKEISYLYNQQKISKGLYIDAHMKSYPYGVKNAEICNRRSKSTYFGEAYFKHYSIKCRSPMINLVWSTLNPISIKTVRPPKSVIIFYTKFDFFSIFQPPNAGIQSTGLGVITLLGLSWILGRLNFSDLLKLNIDKKDLVLLFLNGDNWNFYGKFEFKKLILEKHFPYQIKTSSNYENLQLIEIEHIDLIINIDQLGLNDNKTYFLYDHIHPFIEKFKDISSIPIILEQFSDNLDSLSDFQSLNISTLSILTNAYENMNPYYNSYHDILINLKINNSFLENHIYSLVKTLSHYWNIPIDITEEIKQSLNHRIHALFDCFFQFNCSNLIMKTNEIEEFYFQEVLNNMKENFSFLQPFLYQSDIKNYIHHHFLDASSYIHDILLNWIAKRTFGINKINCEQHDDVFLQKIYQQSTHTCLHVSINSINFIRTTNEIINNRLIFISNFDQPELLIYMINHTKKDLIILLCGLIISICGFILVYFLQNLLPIIFNTEEKF